MDHNKALGLVIKELRQGKELSQEQLAFEVSLHRSYISLLERGLKSATLNTIVKLATAFELSASEMVFKTETKLKND